VGAPGKDPQDCCVGEWLTRILAATPLNHFGIEEIDSVKTIHLAVSLKLKPKNLNLVLFDGNFRRCSSREDEDPKFYDAKLVNSTITIRDGLSRLKKSPRHVFEMRAPNSDLDHFGADVGCHAISLRSLAYIMKHGRTLGNSLSSLLEAGAIGF
jgi:hypothetical protein